MQKIHRLKIISQFIEMFGDPVTNPMGWVRIPFGSLGFLKNGMNFDSREKGVNIHCLGVGDFQSFSKIKDTIHLSKISLNGMPSTDFLLQDGDIVFVRSNGNKELVGRSVIVYPGEIPTTFSGFCIRFRLISDKINLIYLLSVLHNPISKATLLRDSRGANITNLNQKMLSSFLIPLPPLSLQNRFAAFVQQADKSKLVCRKRIKGLFPCLSQYNRINGGVSNV